MHRAAAPKIYDESILFTIVDEDDSLIGARLYQELARPRSGPEFVRFANSDTWKVSFARPDADRMEYQFELQFEDGRRELACDQANPLRAPGPFGERSALEFPGYEAPAWTTVEAPVGEISEHELKSRGLRARLRLLIWSSPGADPREPLPLLVAHDGPEYAQYSGLTHIADVLTVEGRLPPMRIALLAPVDRNETLSASAAYTRALVHELLPAIDALAPTPHGRSMRVGMGASLGGLALLHAHRRSPASFGALFLQSSSFFRQRYDKQESGFPRFRRISRFVGQVLAADDWSHPIPVTMTCGTAEENLANNQAIRDALVRQGYDVSFYENRDAHNWIAWRDTFDPHLVELLNKMWS